MMKKDASEISVKASKEWTVEKKANIISVFKFGGLHQLSFPAIQARLLMFHYGGIKESFHPKWLQARGAVRMEVTGFLPYIYRKLSHRKDPGYQPALVIKISVTLV